MQRRQFDSKYEYDRQHQSEIYKKVIDDDNRKRREKDMI